MQLTMSVKNTFYYSQVLLVVGFWARLYNTTYTKEKPIFYLLRLIRLLRPLKRPHPTQRLYFQRVFFLLHLLVGLGLANVAGVANVAICYHRV